jgi:hypothetical protein
VARKSAFVPQARDYGATAPKAFGAGGMGIRTPGLVIANDALYQLSYTPETGLPGVTVAAEPNFSNRPQAPRIVRRRMAIAFSELIR